MRSGIRWDWLSLHPRFQRSSSEWNMWANGINFVPRCQCHFERCRVGSKLNIWWLLIHQSIWRRILTDTNELNYRLRYFSIRRWAGGGVSLPWRHYKDHIEALKWKMRLLSVWMFAWARINNSVGMMYCYSMAIDEHTFAYLVSI